MAQKSRKLTTAIIVIVLLAAIGYFIYLQYFNQPIAVTKDFDEGLNRLDNALIENSLDLYSNPDKAAILSIPDNSFSAMGKQVNYIKQTVGTNVLKDLADIYLAFVEEYKLRKKLMQDADSFDALSSEEKCASLSKADDVYATQQLLVNKYKSNSSLISDFAAKYPDEYSKTKLIQKLFTEEQLKGFTSELYNMQKAVAEEKQNCQ